MKATITQINDEIYDRIYLKLYSRGYFRKVEKGLNFL